MQARPWSRLLLALLLLWQLGAAVAIDLPHAADAARATGMPLDCCAHHAPSQPGHSGNPGGAPAAPDRCSHAPAACHCAQMRTVALATLEVGEVLPADPPPLAATPSRIDARGSDFFRPPI